MNQRSVLEWPRSSGEREPEREPLPATPFRLGSFRVDPTALKISNGIKSGRVERKVMEVLLSLARRQGETVTREQLLEDAWQGAFVTDGVLHRVVSLLRSALGDDARDPTYIETIPRVGYRLLQPVEWEQLPERPGAAAAQRLPILRWTGPLVALGGIAFLAVAAFQFLKPNDSLETVKVRPLTAEPGYEFHPAISDDGNWLAYAHTDGDHLGGIYVTAADGASQRRLMVAADPEHVYPRAPAWNSDGTQIAWIETSGVYASVEELCRVRIQPLAANAPTQTIDCTRSASLDWSPDNRRLLFDDIDDEGRSRLREVDLASQESTWISDPPEGMTDEHARYSPDGRRIAFVRREVSIRSYVVVIDSSGRQVFEYEPPMGFASGIDWLNGDELVLSVSNGYGVSELWRLRLSDRHIARIPETHGGASPVVSRGQVVFARDAFSSGIWELSPGSTASGPESATPRVQSTRFDANPQIGPDGQTLAFASDRSGSPQIWISDSSGEESILTDLDVHWLGPPRWNEDGNQLIVEGRSTNGFEVFVVDIESRAVRRIDLPFERFREPTWGPDGSMMVSAPADGTWQLWLQDEDGEWQQFTSRGGFVAATSPDRQWVYYTKFRQPGLWRTPAAGGEESQVLDWLAYVNRRDWAVTANSVVAVRKTETGRQMVRMTDSGVDELATIGEGLVFGVTASEESICYGMMEFSGSDIYSIELST